ncbi:hypothetical protein J2T57_001621 [Natronocella acetinitrilica]|uniref:Uncharacterized protein n=1 Tax=Natronocella acetinitrilica TaxID=414046 RepID=A0AAE3G3Q6_9GAMM|nr:hypothetical protein [Natronocella acetinitrilica]MCP1674519.1 hypothetical protein [Natronocella acetinitrilica]
MAASRNAVRLPLRPRGRDEVVTPRPIAGRHAALVEAALAETLASEGETLRALARI